MSSDRQSVPVSLLPELTDRLDGLIEEFQNEVNEIYEQRTD